MSISSNQHRNLRYGVIAAFVVIMVSSFALWLLVNKNISDKILQMEANDNELVAYAISNVIQTAEKDFVIDMNKLSAEKIIRSKQYSKILIKLKGYFDNLKPVKINIINKSGKIIFSTEADVIGKKITGQDYRRAMQGESVSFTVDSESLATSYNVKIHSVVSFVPWRNEEKNIEAVVQVVTDTSGISSSLSSIKHLMLAGVIIGLIILLGIFYFIIRYSDDLVNKYAKQIVMQSKSDPVTGLLNRHHFFRFIRQSIKKTLQQNARAALLIIDIDHFKELNAKYDHTFGDEVLKILVNRLTRILGDSDTLARTGDDEFSIFVEQSGTNTSIQEFAKKILAKVNEPIQIDANYIHLTCSIGISVINQDAKEMEELVHHADSALFNAKDFGRNNVQMYSRGGGVRHIKFYDRQYALNKALEENEYVLYIQPKIDVATGDVVGGEVLLRWNNPDFGMIPPLEFLPALEKSGLIHNVGKWVLNESCRICKRLNEQSGKNIPVSVNVSALQFKNEEFINTVSESLRSNELDGQMLEIELTETCLMDNVEYSLYILTELKKFGIRLTIDDFGTGYSSLNYLKRFPIDVLKIDRSFIANIHDRMQHENAAIVTAIMALSHSLHLDAVAEGVELAEELSYLSALGCKTVQGFLFSEALPVDKFLALLKDNKKIVDRMNNIRQQLA